MQGLPETVASLTREDLAAFHKERYAPGGSALVFAGDVTLDEARALASQVFGAWSGSAPAAVAAPPPSPAPGGKIYLVDRQDAAQTVVSQSLPGLPRTAADYRALAVVNGVWGGAVSARLNLNLREDKGYSYGVFSGLVPYRDQGIWNAAGGVQTNKTKESVAEFESELKGIGGAQTDHRAGIRFPQVPDRPRLCPEVRDGRPGRRGGRRSLDRRAAHVDAPEGL